MSNNVNIHHSSKSLVLAFFIAPLAALPADAVFGWYLGVTPGGGFFDDLFNSALYVLPVSYGITLIFGLPTYIILRTANSATTTNITLSGFPVALLVTFLVLIPAYGFDWGMIPFGALFGIPVSGTAALILRMGIKSQNKD